MFKRIKLLFRISWHLFKVYLQMLYGAWKIAKLDNPIVTIFGGARFKIDDPYAVLAQQLAAKFVIAGVSVVTGGSTGIMEAVGYGATMAKDAKGKSIGIGVRDLGDGKNQYVSEYVELNYFFARKWLLTRFSRAFVVFPGGFGTLDEMSEVITLIQTKHMRCVPIVLVGVEYWQPWFEWVQTEALKHGAVTQSEVDLFFITDDMEKAFNVIYQQCNIEQK